jgi:predicted Zn-dependent protease
MAEQSACRCAPLREVDIVPLASQTDMNPFSLEEIHRLRAAEGWIGLGDWRSANEELEAIAPELHGHPWVLHRRWDVYSLSNDWDLALGVAEVLTRLEPEDKRGWLHKSFALHELKRTNEARDNVLAVLDKFPDYSVMRYNLACYECRLGNLAEARKRLAEAFALPGGTELRAGAMDDPDLRELWNQLGEI